MARTVAGAVPSPNIWWHADRYEIENRSADPDGVIESTMREIRPFAGAHLLDLGCGSGFHLPRFAAEAARVVGVEPHADLVAAARRRTERLPNVMVLPGSAQQLPLPDSSVDVVHARWAYFFGPGCEPGLAELVRVVRRGGAGFVIDNDARESTFGRWFRAAHPERSDDEIDLFFARQGWTTHRRRIRWVFGTRTDFEAVVRIEFAPALADRIIGAHTGLEVDYAIVVRVREF